MPLPVNADSRRDSCLSDSQMLAHLSTLHQIIFQLKHMLKTYSNTPRL